MEHSSTCLTLPHDQPGLVDLGENHQVQGRLRGITSGSPGAQPAVFPTWGPGPLGACDGWWVFPRYSSWVFSLHSWQIFPHTDQTCNALPHQCSSSLTATGVQQFSPGSWAPFSSLGVPSPNSCVYSPTRKPCRPLSLGVLWTCYNISVVEYIIAHWRLPQSPIPFLPKPGGVELTVPSFWWRLVFLQPAPSPAPQSWKLHRNRPGTPSLEGETLLSPFVVVIQSLSRVSFPPRGLQHARLPWPSPSPRVVQTHVHWVSDASRPPHSLSPLSPLSPQSFPASGSFPGSWLFTSGGQSESLYMSLITLNVNGLNLPIKRHRKDG